MKHPVLDLIDLAAEVRHVRAERARRPADSSWFRRHGARLDELVPKFDQLVSRWARPEHRDAWRAHRDGAGEAPEAAPIGPIPLWWGRAQDGSVLEILPRERELVPKQAGDVAVMLDGERLERDLAWQRPTVSLGDVDYVEGSRCPPEALDALRAFLGTGGEPPWDSARSLLDDGLVDRDFSLTDRGRRVVQAMGGPLAATGPRWTRWAG